MADRREQTRIRDEYRRREQEIPEERYAPWNPAEIFLLQDRRRRAAQLLHAAGRFPTVESRCLEIGFGRGGWLPELIAWGACEPNLYGVELEPGRAFTTARRLPAARLAIADGGRLPWRSGRFDLVVLSLVLTSVLDNGLRQRIAAEAERVLAPGGAVLWYDFAVDNPRNPQVRAVGRLELRELFPTLVGKVHSASLAPPLARRLAPRSRWLAELLGSLPFLQTHLLAVLTKPHPSDLCLQRPQGSL
ncbi:MAG: methyltransferase domain-containing protein [Acidobacteriota bacterium]